ncbi:MAG: ABC transporter substrate-binding protein [Thermoleophilia bacterium]|nr:ABC transporter substrate-binding protein [Thermoleophilia bacterium]
MAVDAAGAHPDVTVLTAGAALPLTGRYAPMARDAAAGLRAWARHAGAALEVTDCGEDPRAAARGTLRLAGCGVLFGPYGSGAMRAVSGAFAGRPEVIWNHGGAAAPRTGARVVDVLAPAGRYWADLPALWAADGVPLDRVAVLAAPTGFGREVAAGAVTALAATGHRPLVTAGCSAAGAEAAVRAGAAAAVCCGRFEDDVAAVRALAGRVPAVACVAAGVEAARAALGDAVAGLVGPVQWDPARPPPVRLPADAGYPAAQALAAGLLAQAAIAAAGGTAPDAVWDAARTLRTTTFLGGFAVDAEGRQTAHRVALVRWVTASGEARRVTAVPHG